MRTDRIAPGAVSPSRIPKSAFVFDLDGTLFDLPVNWKAARKEVGMMAGVPMEGVSIFNAIRIITVDDQGLKERLFSVIDSYELPAAENARPIDGSPGLVTWLSSRSKVCLVTMQGKRACHRVLGRFGLDGRFAAVLTRDDSLERSQQLEAACSAAGVPPHEALFCGDKLSDLTAGKKLGMFTVIVGKKGRREWAPDLLLDDVGGLRPLLQ